MEKECCADCWGWEDERCRNKFSPFFKMAVTANHTCQQIQTEQQNTDLHPSAKRDDVWDTGMRFEDEESEEAFYDDAVEDWELLGLDPDTPQDEIDDAWKNQM